MFNNRFQRVDNKRNANEKTFAINRSSMALIILVLIQLCFLVFYASEKQAYFIDEMFTFELANYEGGGWVSRDGDVTSVWNSGDFFRDVLKGKPENRFDFSIPYHNQERDTHPPLHYFFIHLFSSLFPNMDIKWIGLIPNIIFSILTTFSIYYLVRKLTDSKNVSLIASGVWALSVGAMSTAVFVRMYCLLTFLTVLFTALHWPIIKQLFLNNGQGKSLVPYFALAVSTTAGMLTQYQFLLYAFCFCALFCLLALILGKWKTLVCYSIFELGAVGSGVLVFPGCLVHIFSGYRGAEAIAGLSGTESHWDFFLTGLSYISSGCFNGWAKIILIAVILIGLLLWLNRRLLHIRIDITENGITVSKDIYFESNKGTTGWRTSSCYISISNIMFLLLTLAMFCSLLLLVRIIPWNINRYFFNYYPLGALWLVVLIYWIMNSCTLNKNFAVCLILLCIIPCTLASHKMQNVEYLYDNLAVDSNVLRDYQEYPVITLTNGTWDYDADAFMYEYQFHPMVFRCEHGNFSDLRLAYETYDIHDGFLLYAAQNYAWMDEEELFSAVEEQIPLRSHQFIAHLNDCSVHLCVPES